MEVAVFKIRMDSFLHQREIIFPQVSEKKGSNFAYLWKECELLSPDFQKWFVLAS